MKRKFQIALSVIFIIIIFIGIDIRPDFVTAAEIYDYSGFWNCGNAKISVDSAIYSCAFRVPRVTAALCFLTVLPLLFPVIIRFLPHVPQAAGLLFYSGFK